VNVRIIRAPAEREIDGISLAGMCPGTVHQVSSTLGVWLVVERYAVPEMRRIVREEDRYFSSNVGEDPPCVAHDRRRKRGR
jgi:hypothetical protein